MIVVGGEALVDLVPADPGPAGPAGSVSGAVLVSRLGGGPFNVAVALGRLGVPAAMLTRLSTDAFGDAQLGHLAASGVDTSLVTRSAAPTALALATLRPDGSAGYAFYTAGTATAGFTDPGPLPGEVDAVSLGSLGMLLEPGAPAYEAVLRREAAAGRLVALDPNVRPTFVADPAGYRARFRSWLPSVGLLKLSDDDARWLAGRDPRAAALGWLGDGPRAVVLTMGAAGLAVLTGRFTVTVGAVPVPVADTIGAGDTVQAALMAGLRSLGALDPGRLADLDEAGWRDVLGFAARAAAVTCSRPGADPPWAREVVDNSHKPLGCGE